MYDGSSAGQVSAGNFRPDVGPHGFDFTVPLDDRARQVCAKAINIGGGSDVVLGGCTQVPGVAHDPEGHLDSAVRTDGGHVRLVGWASDGDTGGPIQVQGLLDGNNVGQASAGGNRSDVGPHGFDLVVPADWHSHTACVKALNVGGGNDVVVGGCMQVGFALCPDTPATMMSTLPNDKVLGTSGDDVIWAMGGGGQVLGSDGNDIICGAHGNNHIVGGPGNNLIFTGTGDNEIVSGPGHTQVISGGGHNKITVCPNTTVLNQSAADEIKPSSNCGSRPAAHGAAATSDPVSSGSAGSGKSGSSSASTTPSSATPAAVITGSSGANSTAGATTGPTSTDAPSSPGPGTTTTPNSQGGPPPCASATTPSGVQYRVANTGGDGVSVRRGPAPSSSVAYTLTDSDTFSIVCFVDSVPVKGSTRWDRLSDGNWVADVFTTTPKP